MELQKGLGVRMDLSGIQAKSFEVWMGIDLFVSQESTNIFLTIKNLDLTSESTGSEWMMSRAGEPKAPMRKLRMLAYRT